MDYSKLTKEQIIRFLKDTLEYVEKQESIINKAIEYIEKRQDTQKWRKESLKENSTNIDIVLEHYRDILEILKDSDKE